MKAKIALAMVAFFLIGSSACKRNPVDRLIDPNPDGAVPNSSGIYTIYDDELQTGGGLGLIPGGENQSVDVLDASDPKSGNAQMRYTWNGGQVFNSETSSYQHLFAGFSLLITKDFTTFDAATGKDLSAPGYTNLKFLVRGNLSANTKLRIEGPSDSNVITPVQVELDSTQLSSVWTEYTVPITASHFSNVKVFVTFSFQYAQPPRSDNPGLGGTIYVDNIRYE